MIYNQGEPTRPLEQSSKPFLPDIHNPSSFPYSGALSNDIRPRSKSPYQGRTRNPYEFDYQRQNSYQQPELRGETSPISRPNELHYNQPCNKT